MEKQTIFVFIFIGVFPMFCHWVRGAAVAYFLSNIKVLSNRPQ
jgi:hypothetical protein